MIRLGLRLTLGSGREAALRVLVLAAAVGLGSGLLLAVLAGVNGVHAQTDRGAWLDTSTRTPASTSARPASGLWWHLGVDLYGNQVIDRVDVAPAGPGAPIPPGIPRLPGPGGFYASPALTTLIRSVPANELGDRYPGRQVGTIGVGALPSPDSLIVVVGRSVRALSRVPGAAEVRGIQQTAADCYNCRSGVGSGPVLQWILVGGAVALLLPVLILIATASRLSAARREERFAAMRLVGATPAQISVISTVEATVAALAGVALGFAFFFLSKPLLSRVPFTGTRLAPGDLSLRWQDLLLVVAGVPIAAAVSARLALRRAQHSPLGVSRRAASPVPRLVRVVPLLGGVALLAYFDAAGKPASNGDQLLELLVGFVLIVVGLVLAGPWLAAAGSRLMTKRAGRPATLIAGRRLLDNPRGAFRSISGLVIALFVTTAAIGALSSVVAAGAYSVGGSAGKATLADLFPCFSMWPCPASADVRSVSSQVLTEIRATPGVRAVTVLHRSPSSAQQRDGFGLVACAQLAKTPGIGKCAPRATVAAVGWFLEDITGRNSHSSSTIWPSAHLTLAALAGLPVDAVVVATDGAPASIERARTSLERAFPSEGTAVVVEGVDPSTARFLAMIQDMTEVVVVASLIIAACSLAVNVAAGLGERKRPFSLLRLAGVPTAVLHRVVALESAVPLLIVAAVSIVVGLVSAALYLHSQVGISFRMPGITYWATVLGGLGASLAIIASTFPLLDRTTGPEVARNE